MHRVVVVVALFVTPIAACNSCGPPAAEGEGGAAEGEGAAGEGEGAVGEGEGEDLPDAGPAPLDVVGLDARPSNTTCVAPARPVFPSTIDTSDPWPTIQLTSPLFMLQEPGTTTMYVIERGGTIERFDKNDGAVTIPELFGDITGRVQTTDSGNDERGLLGMAFHPDWPTVQEVYLSYTGTSPTTGNLADIVSRFGIAVDGTLDESSEEVLLSSEDPFSNHNGGMIAFSPTDPCRSCLYYGVGDGGNADDHPHFNAQEQYTLLGKMMRIDVDATTPGASYPRYSCRDDLVEQNPGDVHPAQDLCCPGTVCGTDGTCSPLTDLPYGLPADNPFATGDTFCPEVYAYGLRNPWRWSFDRDSGDQWVGDVGQGLNEEVDVIHAGGNYGWNILEGDHCHDETQGSCTQGGFEPNITEYQHGNGRVAIMGGYMYRGSEIQSLQGTYLYADFGSGEVFALFFDQAGNAAPQVVLDLGTNIASFAEDADGELYVISHETGSIKKIVAAGTQPPDDFPQDLSATGCVDPSDATQPASGLIPYTVNHALYSDGAKKDRFMALPDGAKATILPDGDIDFPVGTVFMKTFKIAGQRVETRLLVHHDDGDWGGYSYEWNDAESDAHLVAPAGKTRTLNNGQVWTYPARNGCLACHSLVAHRQLGWEIAQLNGGFVYPNGRFANQLHTLDSIGVFDGPLPGALTDLPAFPPVDDVNAPVETVARAYLHVNCAICHQPGGIGVADTDWRFTTDFGAMSLCNAAPTEGDQGVSGALRMVPGDPAHSLISIRMHKLGSGRMPLLGSTVVDPQGTGVIDNWITQTTACP